MLIKLKCKYTRKCKIFHKNIMGTPKRVVLFGERKHQLTNKILRKQNEIKKLSVDDNIRV